MKILVSAYGCEPNKGSEPWLGWNWSKQIARFNEVWVLTRANNERIIEETNIKREYPTLNFLYFDLPYWLRFWKKGERGLQIYYYLWQLGAYFFIRRIYKKRRFDLIHHISVGGNWRPVFLALLPIPFIWGPAGSEDIPSVFWRDLPIRGKIYEAIRFLFRLYGLRMDPFTRMTFKKAILILDCNSKWVKLTIPSQFKAKAVRFFQNGIDVEEYTPTFAKNRKEEKLNIIVASKMVHWKGVSLAARAFASYAKKDDNGQLIMIGDGPDRKRIEDLFFRENLLTRVRFLGNLPLHDFNDELRKADIFLFTPFHQGQATAVMQAMALGIPIIGIDCDAIGETVTSDCGILVTPRSISQCIEDLAGAILLLARDEGKRRRLGRNARKRAEDRFAWEKRGEELEEIYERYIYPKIKKTVH